MQIVRVRLKANPYPIYVSGNESPLHVFKVFRKVPRQGAQFDRVIVLTNPTIARLCLPTLQRGIPRISTDILTLPDGERWKTLDTVARAYRGLTRLHADRKTLILLLGGGVIGDLGGFAAATYLRGIPFIQVPTTLVAQVDSSIGGKLGVDLPNGKNLVGVFQQPQAVLSHVPFLRTLPAREIQGGLAEVVKYGVIQDPTLLELVLKKREAIFRRDIDLLCQIVLRSSKIKAMIVSRDEKETRGFRMILNFGHTFGHALERLTRYRRFHHGEAISIGMAIAATASYRQGFCSQRDAEAMTTTIEALGLPVKPPSFSKERWVRALSVDKKSRDGMIHFVFLREMGKVFVKPISPKELIRFL